MPVAGVRAEYIDVIARAMYEARWAGRWAAQSETTKGYHRREAAQVLDDLIEAGLIKEPDGNL